MRKFHQISGELELHLAELANIRPNDFILTKEDPNLKRLVGDAKEANLDYIMKASYPNATNNQAADELAGILKQASHSPLYRDSRHFLGKIFYKEKDRYVSRD